METLHATLMIVDGVGVLITGESGTGKSECALNLLSRGHILVADDVVLIEKTSSAVIGKAPARFAGLLEIDDIGIFNVTRTFGKTSFAAESRVDLCLELRNLESAEKRTGLGNERSYIEIQGRNVPHFLVHASPGRNLACIAELAAKLFQGDLKEVEGDLIAEHNSAVACDS